MLLQACKLLVRSERTKDGDVVVRLSNSVARMLSTLRKRKGELNAGPTLEEHIAKIARLA